MANTKEIRVKIDSTKKTQQTTRAMKMVSAAKLRRAQHAIVNARPYARKLDEVIYKIAHDHRVEHPLFTHKENPQKILLVVLTSDRGLCGGFNSSVIKFTDRYLKEISGKYEKLDMFFVGRKAADFFKRRNIEPVETMLNLVKDVSYGLASDVAERLLNLFMHGEYDEIRLIYNEFKSAISQKVVCEKLLPVLPDDSGTDKESATDIIFEPSPEVVMDELLRRHFAIQVYRCMQESIASEHGARMSAMESATKNAGERIHSLTLYMNKVRQAAITTELIEITSGAEILNG